MNQNMDTSNNQNVSPYKAAGNLNTMISNPSANINDTMNVNIQNIQKQNEQSMSTAQQLSSQEQLVQNNSIKDDTANIEVKENSEDIVKKESVSQTYNIQPENVNPSVEKEYVSTENKAQKKTVSFDMGPEFKLALLIVIILLVFILLLPLVPNIFRG